MHQIELACANCALYVQIMTRHEQGHGPDLWAIVGDLCDAGTADPDSLATMPVEDALWAARAACTPDAAYRVLSWWAPGTR